MSVQRSSSAVISRAVADYKKNETKIDHDVIVAMVAYTSGYFNSRQLTSKQMKQHIDARLAWMRKNKQVTANYTKAPNKDELRWYASLMTGWYKYAGWRYTYPTEMREDFTHVVTGIIFAIQDYEYAKRGIGR